MGNDGGSIPTRRELVKEAARNPTNSELKETQQEQQQWSWKNCPLSHGALVRPIVSDSAGKLYNKDVVLQFLLPTATSAEKADGEAILQGRVKSLRDVVQVKFEVDDDEDEDRQGKGGAGAAEHENWVCPITRKRLGPNVKSSYIVPCGHAFSDSAIKEVSGGSCLQCNESYTTENIIPILATSPMEAERLDARIKQLKEQGLTHSLKKASGSGKKRKKDAELSANNDARNDARAVLNGADGESDSNNHAMSTLKSSTGGINNAATASLTTKVLQDEDERKKRQKLGMNDNLKGLFSTDGTAKETKQGDFMTRGYSIPTAAKR